MRAGGTRHKVEGRLAGIKAGRHIGFNFRAGEFRACIA